MTSGSEDTKSSKGCRDSVAFEESNGGETFGGNGPLKKGPWTSAEDAILVEYVNRHGEGNWNAVQKQSGLSRCGKSCRLRWANHLRPDLKKGAFTPEEERRIIQLHAKMGNKWARMAVELPGRTDNEIKNYWNTRTKRLQRAGLPIYPPEVCLQVFDGSHETQNIDTLQNGGKHGLDMIPNDHFDIPEVDFKRLELKQGVLSYSPTLLDIHPSSMLKRGLCSSHNYSFMFPTMCPPKRLRVSETIFPGLDGSVNGGVQAFSQTIDHACEKIAEPFGLSSYDSDLNTYYEPTLGVFPGSHALLNDNSSSSEPICGAMKLELPSFQYPETQRDSWGTSTSLLPLLESFDTLIQSPPTEQTQSDCLSPLSSGLLEAVLHESRTLKNQKQNSGHCQSSNTSAAPSDAVDRLPANPCSKMKWEMHLDPNSPLGHSAASVFSECTPISGISSEETGCDVKPQVFLQDLTPYVEKFVPDHDQMDVSRPDVLLDSGWFGHNN